MRQTPTTLLAMTLALVLGGPGAALAADAEIGPFKISNAHAPATAEGAKDAPGYFTVTNTGSAPDTLIGGSFADANRLAIVSGAGKATRDIPGGLVIKPGETITLSPSGPHIMFVGLIGSLEPGLTAQSILHFEKAGTGVVEFTVEGGAPKAARRHKH